MEQRPLGCGGKPAYGPISRGAEIWQAIKDEDEATREAARQAEQQGKERIIQPVGPQLIEEGLKLNFIGPKGTYYRSVQITPKNDAKCCGDLDNNASFEVYICFECVNNLQKRKDFLKKYDE
jgi:hypothetical protein